MKYKPRRPLDDTNPDGYMESDRDYLENNRELAVALLDNCVHMIEALKALRTYEQSGLVRAVAESGLVNLPKELL